MDLVEGLYLGCIGTKHKQLVYIRDTKPNPMYLHVFNDTVLHANTGFRSFNPNSTYAHGLTLLVPCQIPDRILISSLYPELFI